MTFFKIAKTKHWIPSKSLTNAKSFIHEINVSILDIFLTFMCYAANTNNFHKSYHYCYGLYNEYFQ